MSDFGYLLYGFYKKGQKSLSIFLGLDGKNQLEIVHLDDSTNLACVVSRVPLDEFGEGKLQENLQDIKWVEKYIRAYDEITQKLFSQTTFIPVRFGTVYLNQERVKQGISGYKKQVIKLIEKLNGKIELGVKFLLDRKKLQETLSKNDSEAADLNHKIQHEAPGKAHFLKKRLETLVQKKSNDFSSDISQNLLNSLKGIANDIQLLNLQPREGPHKMFLNVACLLSSDKLNWFKEMLQNIMSQENFNSINCEITGPWPPYSFVRLQDETQKKEEVKQ